jgi:hydrogenase maturation factor HypE
VAAGLRGAIDTSGWGGIALQSALLSAVFAAVGIPLIGGLRLKLPGARVRGARAALTAAART